MSQGLDRHHAEDPSFPETTPRGIVAGVAVLAVIALGFTALDRLTHEIRYADVRDALLSLSATQIVLSMAFTAMSYFALTFYDVLALGAIGRPLPWRTAALASFSSYTLSHNLCLSLLAGGSPRYRIYGSAGLDGPDIARVIALAAALFWAGVVAISGLAMVVHSGPLQLASLTIDALILSSRGSTPREPSQNRGRYREKPTGWRG